MDMPRHGRHLNTLLQIIAEGILEVMTCTKFWNGLIFRPKMKSKEDRLHVGSHAFETAGGAEKQERKLYLSSG